MSGIFGSTLTFSQEEGEDVRLVVFGDDKYARYETLDGYSVVYDADRAPTATRRPTARAPRAGSSPPARPLPHRRRRACAGICGKGSSIAERSSRTG